MNSWLKTLRLCVFASHFFYILVLHYTPFKINIMKEDFLHYLWKFKKFNTSNLQTTNHQTIFIQHSGQYLQLAGPDFFNAQIQIDNQKWAGNVEIHVKSSDWYLHHHENDSAYDNVILHVVWQHDMAIYRKDNTEIPTLVLKDYVAPEIITQFKLDCICIYL